jgi:hypothetical protein
VKKVFEIGLLCICGVRMQIVFFITNPCVVDRILPHCESERSRAQDPFETRAPRQRVAVCPH